MSNANGHSLATALLFLHAQTSLHPGSGTALGVVDLPVQRERHTQWPVIPGSTLKGILRDACREQARASYGGDRKRTNEEDPKLVAVFGPAEIRSAGDAHAGALSVTDARVLAFPVRSLRGVFAWVTCPAVLERLNRDLKLARHEEIKLPSELKALKGSEAACPKDSPLLLADGGHAKLVLEEFEFTRVADANNVAHWIAGHAVSDEFTRERLKSHLVVLEDDDFTHFVRHATEVVARIGLDYEKKTVKEGALFYQEFLPAETIFYALVFASDSRAKRQEKHEDRQNDTDLKAPAVLEYVRSRLDNVKVLQIGGDETTGKGLCAVRLSNGKEGAQ